MGDGGGEKGGSEKGGGGEVCNGAMKKGRVKEMEKDKSLIFQETRGSL